MVVGVLIYQGAEKDTWIQGGTAPYKEDAGDNDDDALEIIALKNGFVYLATSKMVLSLCLQTMELQELFPRGFRANYVLPYVMAWPPSLVRGVLHCSKILPATYIYYSSGSPSALPAIAQGYSKIVLVGFSRRSIQAHGHLSVRPHSFHVRSPSGVFLERPDPPASSRCRRRRTRSSSSSGTPRHLNPMARAQRSSSSLACTSSLPSTADSVSHHADGIPFLERVVVVVMSPPAEGEGDDVQLQFDQRG
ncbi:hypothetical protein PR202_ga20780 [Eleusine coracana subsp. coracana]|uniref:Uncharacterized protein n=1 Tax=Eleusine coracana subsp. coracana TaxID=191504 RepID=A0AAV5CZC5_ELECO|nr:hypothetical protein PR202_ga20780 [Eleusine coracana subsp. coracana]